MMKREKGFTQSELLMIAFIAMIVMAVAAGFLAVFNAKERVEKATEQKRVQQVVNQLMSKEGVDYLSNPVISKKATKDMSLFPDPQYPLYPKYLKEDQTENSYWIETDGTVHQK